MKWRSFPLMLSILVLSACGPVTSAVPSPTPDIPLPDLVVTTAYVSIVDFNGNCLPSFDLLVTVSNQSDVPAENVLIVETSTGHQIQAGALGAFQSVSVNIPAASPTGSYTVVADPRNAIAELDENNNSLSAIAVTATPPPMCAQAQSGSPSPTPFPPVTPDPQGLDGLVYADLQNEEIVKVTLGNQNTRMFNGVFAQFSQDGKTAIDEIQGDLMLFETVDTVGINITNTSDRIEHAPRLWSANPSKIVFNSLGVNEAQEKGWGRDVKGWSRGSIGYLSVVNVDGSEYAILDDIPSYTSPSLSPDGRTIAYERSGEPMLYEIGTGSRPFDPALYNYQPGAETIFLSPSHSPDGTRLLWWVTDNISQAGKHYDLVVFDLTTNSSGILHSYTPLSEPVGWLPNPVWSPNGNWIAFQTLGEVNAWDLWIMHGEGGIGNRFDLATNPVWNPDALHLAFARQSENDSPFMAELFVVETPSWNIQQMDFPPGSIPLAWPPSFGLQ